MGFFRNLGERITGFVVSDDEARREAVAILGNQIRILEERLAIIEGNTTGKVHQSDSSQRNYALDNTVARNIREQIIELDARKAKLLGKVEKPPETIAEKPAEVVPLIQPNKGGDERKKAT